MNQTDKRWWLNDRQFLDEDTISGLELNAELARDAEAEEKVEKEKK